jgi:hypothetical protein
VPYVARGDRFVAEASIIAGIPSRRGSLNSYLQNKYDPLTEIAAKRSRAQEPHRRSARKKGVVDWTLATLGRLPAEKVRTALNGDPLLERLGPLLLLSSTTNWLAEDTVDIDLKFLLKQNL